MKVTLFLGGKSILGFFSPILISFVLLNLFSFCYLGWGELKKTLSHGLRFYIRTQRRTWGLNPGKSKFTEERTERTPQERNGSSQGRHGSQSDEPRVFKTGLLHIHVGRCELTVLIDSCKLQNNRLYCLCLSHNPVCYNQMYVCMDYLWTLNRLRAT